MQKAQISEVISLCANSARKTRYTT